MSATTKVILALVAATLVSLWWAVSSWSAMNVMRTERDEAIALQKATQARLEGIQKQMRKVSSDYATAELRLHQLHSTLPDRPTDRRVYQLLCERGNCAKVDPVPTPAD